jgi:hypothetical protein
VIAAALLVELVTLAPVRAQEPAAAPSWRVDVNGGREVLATPDRVVLRGTTDARPGSLVAVTVDGTTHSTTVTARGEWLLVWPQTLVPGSYAVVAEVATGDGRRGRGEGTLLVRRLPRRPIGDAAPAYAAPPAPPRGEDFQEQTDRWRITPPPYELNATPAGRWDPYNQNVWKGDFPIRGDDLFLVLTGVSDTLLEGRTLPTPAGVSTADETITFFGGDRQLFASQLLLVSADLFRGDTAFRPFDWRVKGTLAANLNHLDVEENAVVNPDVRRGTSRTDSHLSLEELFVEKKLADLSPAYDFVSVRAGIQPFTSDFRGFLFSDLDLGVRLFGNFDSNRWQGNLAFFERLEKDTNSGLNTFARREQQVAVANLYRQDFPRPGHTVELSVHYLRDGPSFHFDDNGFLARPDPVGDLTPHEVEVVYLGYAGAGHFGRVNVDSALYFAAGRDSLNPIAGRQLVEQGGQLVFEEEVDVRAVMAALELSIDRDWYRPKIALFYASGDDDLNDRDAEGFDAISDRANFAGGGFSFWNRMAIKLAGTGVTLVNRGSLLPDLKTSREEGQPNFVNPGLRLVSVGLDAELTPKLKTIATANYASFDQTEVIEGLLFQAPIDRELGWDVSVGARWRPYLNQNVVVLGGIAAFRPGRGFRQIFERKSELFHAFTTVTLTF